MKNKIIVVAAWAVAFVVHAEWTGAEFVAAQVELNGHAVGATNVLSALVTRGWWRDQITGKRGLDTGFRGVLTLRYADGTAEDVITDGSWLGGTGGPVVDATIFDGETYDARIPTDWMRTGVAPTTSGRMLRRNRASRPSPRAA